MGGMIDFWNYCINILGQLWLVQPLLTSYLLARGDSSKDVLDGFHHRKNKEKKGEKRCNHDDIRSQCEARTRQLQDANATANTFCLLK